MNNSIWQFFFDPNELWDIKSVNEIAGKDVYTFSEGSNHSLLKIWLRNERMIDRKSEWSSVSCLQILQFWRLNTLCVPFFGSPSTILCHSNLSFLIELSSWEHSILPFPMIELRRHVSFNWINCSISRNILLFGLNLIDNPSINSSKHCMSHSMMQKHTWTSHKNDHLGQSCFIQHAKYETCKMSW